MSLELPHICTEDSSRQDTQVTRVTSGKSKAISANFYNVPFVDPQEEER